MKKIYIVFVLLIAISMKAQYGEPLSYSEVVKVSDSNKTAKQLYASSKMWFTKVFNNPKYVIQLDDVDNNTIVGRGSFDFTSNIFMGTGQRSGKVKFDVTVSSKDGRYKFVFSDFIHEKAGLLNDGDVVKAWDTVMIGGKEFRKKVSKELYDHIDKEVATMVNTLKDEMDKKSISKDDW